MVGSELGPTVGVELASGLRRWRGRDVTLEHAAWKLCSILYRVAGTLDSNALTPHAPFAAALHVSVATGLVSVGGTALVVLAR